MQINLQVRCLIQLERYRTLLIPGEAALLNVHLIIAVREQRNTEGSILRRRYFPGCICLEILHFNLGIGNHGAAAIANDAQNLTRC